MRSPDATIVEPDGSVYAAIYSGSPPYVGEIMLINNPNCHKAVVLTFIWNDPRTPNGYYLFMRRVTEPNNPCDEAFMQEISS